MRHWMADAAGRAGLRQSGLCRSGAGGRHVGDGLRRERSRPVLGAAWRRWRLLWRRHLPLLPRLPHDSSCDGPRHTPFSNRRLTVRHTGPCLRSPHTLLHPCCVHAQMRLSHNGLSSSSLLGSWCWEKVQAAGGTLNASNLPNRSACFPGAEDWVGVIDSWQASPRPARPRHPAHATPRSDRALTYRPPHALLWARLIACGTRAAQDHRAATGRRGGHPQPPSQVGWLLERPHPCRGGRGPDRWPATLLPRQRAGDARHRRPSRKAAGVA